MQMEERRFLCEGDDNERIFSVNERENKNTQSFKLQRILNNIDINMTLVKYFPYLLTRSKFSFFHFSILIYQR